MIRFQKSVRLEKLPPYVFSVINKKKRALKERGVDLIDLGMGDPDLATPPAIVETLREEVLDPNNHRYAIYQGLDEFRQAAATWLEKRFSVRIDPQNEVINLIGSKEGLVNFTLAVVNPGDFCLIPDPAYPVYTNAVILAGGSPVYYPLRHENQFRPNWKEISEDVWKACKLIYINFPNNPTSATVELETYRELAELAKKHNTIVVSDTPYCEHGLQGLAPCFLQVPDAKDIGVEFFSLSKTYNMTGWRVGFAAGNPELIAALLHMKSCVDTGVFKPIQKSAITALLGDEKELVFPSREVFRYRRQLMIEGLTKLGYEVFDGHATFYLWIRCPGQRTSMQVCEDLLERGLVCTPGVGFGSQGEGWFRMALTLPEERLKEALRRMPAA